MPDRIDFDPVPWQSMAVWMLTQMKRWGYIKGDVDYKAIAEQVFLLTDAKKQMKELDQKTPDGAYRKYQRHGQGVRPGEAGRVRGELRDQEGLSDGAARCARSCSRRCCRLAVLAVLLLDLAPRDPADGGGARGDRLTPEQIEYAKLLGKDPARRPRSRPAFRRWRRWAPRSWRNLAHPFYDNGPNDKGIGIQLA